MPISYDEDGHAEIAAILIISEITEVSNFHASLVGHSRDVSSPHLKRVDWRADYNDSARVPD